MKIQMLMSLEAREARNAGGSNAEVRVQVTGDAPVDPGTELDIIGVSTISGVVIIQVGVIGSPLVEN